MYFKCQLLLHVMQHLYRSDSVSCVRYGR